MSFKSRDLMIDVLPTAQPFAQPGFVLCGQITAGGGGNDEDAGLDCGQATAPEPKTLTGAEAGLALLRHQLHESLSAAARV
ncbi:MAG TPA: hypothetical protein VKK31_10910 [Thermoanaerobaculia bacterium]|nr:hypothetical protein [Thermoanaerobaculia bacterium]